MARTTRSPSSLTWRTPLLGGLDLTATPRGLRRVAFHDKAEATTPAGDSAAEEILRRAVDEIERYLSGELTEFTVPLDPPEAAGFHGRVQALLREIPYGELVTYAELAERAGSPRGRLEREARRLRRRAADQAAAHRPRVGPFRGRVAGHLGGRAGGLLAGSLCLPAPRGRTSSPRSSPRRISSHRRQASSHRAGAACRRTSVSHGPGLPPTGKLAASPSAEPGVWTSTFYRAGPLALCSQAKDLTAAICRVL